jgi:hypothetical protein
VEGFDERLLFLRRDHLQGLSHFVKASMDHPVLPVTGERRRCRAVILAVFIVRFIIVVVVVVVAINVSLRLCPTERERPGSVGKRRRMRRRRSYRRGACRRATRSDCDSTSTSTSSYAASASIKLVATESLRIRFHFFSVRFLLDFPLLSKRVNQCKWMYTFEFPTPRRVPFRLAEAFRTSGFF